MYYSSMRGKWAKIPVLLQLGVEPVTLLSITQAELNSVAPMISYLPFLRWAGEWVDSVDAKHAGAGLGDAIICDKHKCD